MKKKILISIYDMEIGGVERSLINMLESFDFNKYDVDLLICNHAGDFMNLIPMTVNILPEVDEYTVFRKSIIQCIREGNIRASIVRILSKIIARKKAKRRHFIEGSGYIQMQLVSKYVSCFLPKYTKKYDVAISYAWPHNIVASRIDANKKIAWIHTDYSTLEIDNKIDFNMWSKFDYIVSISDECTNAFLMKYPLLKRKIIMIENITSPKFIQQMADETIVFDRETDRSFNIVSVGRLSYAKGFDIAIKALRVLHDRGFNNMKWYVVGYGSDEAILRKLIEELKLENSFVLLGKKKNPYPYMKACDLYVQPSRYEGKAVTVGEAQILSKPVMITNYSTAESQVVNGFDGYITELSIEGIANGIEKLYKDPHKRKKLITNCTQTDYGNSCELKKLYELMQD